MDSADRTVALLHLRKTFTSTLRERNGSLQPTDVDSLLPMFSQLSARFTPDELGVHFKEAAHFAAVLAEDLVLDIRRRANNESTAAAAESVYALLRAFPADSRGWTLLKSLSYLASAEPKIVEALCKAALPSTLAKVLYLFLDLPTGIGGDEVEHRQRLFDLLVMMMISLAGNECVAEELIQKDDLVLLFVGAASHCETEHSMWRDAAFTILCTIVGHSMNASVLKYVHSKGCVQHYLQQLQSTEVDDGEMSALLSNVVDLLKVSADFTPLLIEDMVNAGGFERIAAYCQKAPLNHVKPVLNALSLLVAAGEHAVPLTNPQTPLSFYPFQLGATVARSTRTIRVPHPFAVFDRCFQSGGEALCLLVLQHIRDILKAETMNYFILEREYPLSVFVEKMNKKPLEVQKKALELVESILRDLNFIPCKELSALNAHLRSALADKEYALAELYFHFLFTTLSVNVHIKDAYRELLHLETFLTHIQQNCSDFHLLPAAERTLTQSALDLLVASTKNNPLNAQFITENMEMRTVKAVLSADDPTAADFRSTTHTLLRHLLFLAKNEQLFSALLQILFSDSGNYRVCMTVLRVFDSVLLESHKVRIMFRKSGGYICLMTLLLQLEGAIGTNVAFGDELTLLLEHTTLIFRILTTSMRYEPSNAKYFLNEVKPNIITSILRTMGAFTDVEEVDVKSPIWTELKIDQLREKLRLCHQVFQMGADGMSGADSGLPPRLFCGLYLLRLLLGLAMDDFGKQQTDIQWAGEDWLSSAENVEIIPVVSWSRSVLVHPSALLCILQLLPGVVATNSAGGDLDEWSALGQYYVALVLKALLRFERSQQLMCEHEMPKIVLDVAESLFRAEHHPLLSPFHYLFERLACQALHPRELRRFLRLDQPLCCANLDADDAASPTTAGGGPIPIHRVKALVSMLTPRNHVVLHAPPFVEFDLAVEGFACLFVPSLAHGSAAGAATPTSERLFPPLNGLTFMTWLFLDELTTAAPTDSPSRKATPPVRLLAVVRSVDVAESHSHHRKEAGALEDCLTCLYVHYDVAERSLIICTEEHQLLDELRHDYAPPLASDKCVRMPLLDGLLPLRQWTHVAVVFSRSLLRPSQVDVHLNGRLVGSQKLQYIQPNVGGAAAQLADAHSVHALIGTPPFLRRAASQRFRLAGSCLLEDVVGVETLREVCRLRPHYVGNFQQSADSPTTPLIAEERLLVQISAAAASELAMNSLRAMLRKADAELVATLLGIGVADANTPLKVLWNGAAHGAGPQRAVGAIVIGYLGMRTFAPSPVSAMLDAIGGAAPLLGLVQMSDDSHGLYAALKVLVSATQTNGALADWMERQRGYQTLAVLLEEKIRLVNSHILHLVLTLAGTVDTANNELAVIPNQQTFEDLLCDLELWSRAPDDVQRHLFEHFYELVIDQNADNLAKVRASSLLNRLLIRIVERPSIFVVRNEILFKLVGAIIQPPCDAASFLRFGQAIASTLPTQTPASLSTLDAAPTDLPFHIAELEKLLQQSAEKLDAQRAADDEDPSDRLDADLYSVYVRNRLLNILQTMLAHSSGSVNQQLSECVVQTLGFGWLMAQLSPGVHSGTAFLSLRILLNVTKHSALMQKFKDGSQNGGWLQDADAVIRNRAAVLLGFSVAARGGAVGSHVDINPELAKCEGFAALEQLLAAHANRPFAYLTVLAMLFNQHGANVQPIDEFSVDLIWSHVFALNATGSVYEALAKVDYCPEALIPLFAMLRVGLHFEVLSAAAGEEDAHWSRNYPLMILQLINFLYQNLENFVPICHSEVFVIALFTVLIPPIRPNGNSAAAEPKTPTVLAGPSGRCARSITELLSNILLNDLCFQHDDGRTEWLFDSLVEFLESGGEMHYSQSALYTEVVNACVDRFISSDMFFANSALLVPKSAEGQLSHSTETTAVNVVHFLSKVIDSVWNCLYRGNPVRILKCFLKMLAEAHVLNKAAAQLACTETHLTALFRIVLFLLSRPIDNVDTQMSVVDTLAEIIRNQHLLLSATYNNPLFYGALVHLVFMLSEPPDIQPQPHGAVAANEHLQRGSAQVAVCAQSVWGILWQKKRPLLEEIFRRPIELDLYSARAACAETANRCWLQFVDAQASGGTSMTSGPPSAGFRESARQVGGHLQQHIQSKLTRVARSGLKRLTSTSKSVLGTSMSGSFDRSGPMANAVVFRYEKLKVEPETFHMWIRVHVSLLRELIRSQSQRYVEWHAHVRKWSLHDWHEHEAELTRERGVWGPERRSALDKFQLDTSEGPCRLRKKLLPDPTFYRRYPYRPALDAPDAKPYRAKVAICRDAKTYYERMRQRRWLTMDERIVDWTAPPTAPNGGGGLTPKAVEAPMSVSTDEQIFDAQTELSVSVMRRAVKKSVAAQNRPTAEQLEGAAVAETDNLDEEEEEEEPLVEGEAPPDDEEEQSVPSTPLAAELPQIPEVEPTESPKPAESRKSSRRQSAAPTAAAAAGPSPNEPDNQTLLRLLEEGEQLHSMFRCARVHGLDTIEGLLLFGRHHFYVVDGFTLLKTREIRDLDFLPEQFHDPIIPYMAMGSSNRPSTRANRQCSKFAYEDIREVHKRRYLLQPIALEVFSADGRNYLLAFPRKIRDRVHQKIAAMGKNCVTVSNERPIADGPASATQLIGQFLNLGQQSMTQRWQCGEVSNFDYLMYLNTMAGRTYNDLSQYPVFPWILRDYDSDRLDLTNPDTFRCLAKPMGAQTPDRLSQFLKRFHEWDDPTGDTPPYMYGTHYSSAMIVLSYLVRLEPFTQQFLKLQGGHFDLADRMFHSVGDAWWSAARNNMADVKELIPEFFYLPEMFANANAFDFGAKQSGVVLDGIVLPKWAHGDAHEFIRLHRQALECDHVSEHLHEWIDLIFGYRQQGDTAKDAFNVFHHLFYEENVDLDAVADPLTRNATLAFINNFGQIPAQLFRKPHPQKKISGLNTTVAATAVTANSSTATAPLIQTVPGVSCAKVFYHALETLRPLRKPVKELRGAVGDILVNEKNQVIVLEQNKVFVPPNAFIAWGFNDRSVRLGQIGAERSVCILETNDSAEINCVAAAENRQIFAGLSTGAIVVWGLEAARRRGSTTLKRPTGAASATSTLASAAASATGAAVAGVVGSPASRDVADNSAPISARNPPRLRRKRVLAAHTDGVTALAVCANHNFLVSASRDHTAVVWHLTQLTFIRQLGTHGAAVSAVSINEATGDIATASGSVLTVWSLNGDELARVNTADAGLFSNSSSLILCLSFSALNGWDARNVVACGTRDGLVKFYSMEYKKTIAPAETATSTDSGAHSPKSPGPRALKEHFLRRQRKLQTAHHRQRLSSAVSEDSTASTPSAASGDGDSTVTAADDLNAEPAEPKWQRVCQLRRVLTEHTAYHSHDNQRPAPITSIAPSRDHRNVFVGDGVGRVWMWGMDQTNPPATNPSTASTAEESAEDRKHGCCADCGRVFAAAGQPRAVGAQSGGVARQRNDCKNCGRWFCENCISPTLNPRLSAQPVAVCRQCSAQLQQRKVSQRSTQ